MRIKVIWEKVNYLLVETFIKKDIFSYLRMDLASYCRDENLVAVSDFLEYINDPKFSLIFVGENHFSDVHRRNEKAILSQVAGQNKFILVTEDLSHPRYEKRREMFEGYVFVDHLYVPSESRPATDKINNLLKDGLLVLAVLGNNHLKNALTVDSLVRSSNCNIGSVVITQEDSENPPQEGVYKVHGPTSLDYHIVGELC